jgi:hypothetical protein
VDIEIADYLAKKGTVIGQTPTSKLIISLCKIKNKKKLSS